MLAPSKSSVNGLMGLCHLDCCNSFLKGLFSPYLLHITGWFSMQEPGWSLSNISQPSLIRVKARILTPVQGPTWSCSKHFPDLTSDYPSPRPFFSRPLCCPWNRPGIAYGFCCSLHLEPYFFIYLHDPSFIPNLGSNAFSVTLSLTIQFKTHLHPIPTHTLLSSPSSLL